jgi:predicted RNA-binding Zn ribbon-like protein
VDSAGAAFQLFGGHPVLDLVNTLDNRFVPSGPDELLVSYSDLVRFVVQSGLIKPDQSEVLVRRRNSPAAARVLTSTHQLREILAAMFYGDLKVVRPASPTDIRTLARHVHAAQSHQELVWRPRAEGSHGEGTVEWTWGRSEARAEIPLWILSLSADRLLTSAAARSVHMCDCETCRWLFVDTSKNHSRKWCDMKVCGNRMKARRFSVRLRGA